MLFMPTDLFTPYYQGQRQAISHNFADAFSANHLLRDANATAVDNAATPGRLANAQLAADYFQAYQHLATPRIPQFAANALEANLGKSDSAGLNGRIQSGVAGGLDLGQLIPQAVAAREAQARNAMVQDGLLVPQAQDLQARGNRDALAQKDLMASIQQAIFDAPHISALSAAAGNEGALSELMGHHFPGAVVAPAAAGGYVVQLPGATPMPLAAALRLMQDRANNLLGALPAPAKPARGTAAKKPAALSPADAEILLGIRPP